jgi:hypothetical protein
MRSLHLIALLLTLAYPTTAQVALTPEMQARQDSIRKLSIKDHAAMMAALGITTLRPGANGNDPKSPYAANYDEAKATVYPSLPNPLVLDDGSKVTTAAQWWNKRRPEIIEQFDREILGRVPKELPAISWKVISTLQEKVGGVDVTTKQLIGHVDNSDYPEVSVDIELSLSTPTSAKGRVPIVMELTWKFPPGFRRPATNEPTGPTWQEQVIAKGWGYATIVPVSIQPDNGAGLKLGIIGLAAKGKQRQPDDWGALRAWAWGASRALDYFETDSHVDPKRVALEGHSRYGKAVAVAMAYDPRFAVAFVSSSGEGGLSLYRRNYGEIVENVAGSGEYHWMAGNFIKYAGPLKSTDLPIDAHELLALSAPRPVFISSGLEGDQWCDPKGMFLAGVYAGPVYKLLGKKGLSSDVFPPLQTLVDGDVAFRQHAAGHVTGPNWPTFLTFAERYLK